MLLVVFKEIKFTAFFSQKIWDRKVDKNDLNFNEQYIYQKEYRSNNVTNIIIEIN